jgi:alpha-tubulin suppressor-like RCC1 family protein
VRTPKAVFGNHPFIRVSAAYTHTCATTLSNQAWCWGSGNGVLGNGSTETHLTPVAVSGGLAFDQVSAGTFHTCGKTTSGAGYCWGSNVGGELGIGGGLMSATPAAVAGPS